VGICRDANLDDIGFLETVVADLPRRLPLAKGKVRGGGGGGAQSSRQPCRGLRYPCGRRRPRLAPLTPPVGRSLVNQAPPPRSPAHLPPHPHPPQYYLSGESAGGMMVHALLCQSRAVASAVDAAADMLGGISADYAASKCAAPATEAVPFMKLHGIEDPNIPYAQRRGAEVLVDGVAFLGARDAAAVRARNNGCGAGAAGPEESRAGGRMLCTDLCAKAEPAAPPALVCGMPGVKHDTDHPQPGFVYERAFEFFTSAPPKGSFVAVPAKPMPAEAKEAARAAAAKSIVGGGGSPAAAGGAPASAAPSGGEGTNVGAIAGGVVGGAIAAAAAGVAGGVGAAIAKRRRRQAAAEEAAAAAAGSGSEDYSSVHDADVVMDVEDGAGPVVKAV
jgi:hypothetical protein